MNKLEYTVRFVTPAFLGDADQQGHWRTPPFKALLRHWWRILEAPSVDYDWKKLRQREGELLGHAWLEKERGGTWAMRSRVRLRLTPWVAGSLAPGKWPGAEFGQVKTTLDGRGRVREDQYLGYGPITNQRQLAKPAVGTNETAALTMLYRGEDPTGTLNDAVRLIHWFGTLGSRARNGWGSVALDDGTGSWTAIPKAGSGLLRAVSRPWEDCLEREWPHGIGTDANGRPLIWLTEPLPQWRAVIGRLANVKVRVRRVAKGFSAGKGQIGGPHLLGYPAGRGWEIRQWGNEGRLASQLRFKALADRDNVRGMIYHVPCAVPESLRAKLSKEDRRWLEKNQTQIWAAIHRELDGMDGLNRLED